ncbi:MAG: lysozyme [Bacteroidales bacterium]|nr:lysozyme [Bacteroidales bacterium]
MSIAMSLAVLLSDPKPLNTNSNELQGLMLHCSASPEGRDVRATEIANFHTRTRSRGGRGWKKPGYNDVLELNALVNLISYNDDTIVQVSEIANGAVGYNRVLRHVVYVGGMDSSYSYAKNTLTHFQDSVLKVYIFNFLEKYPNAWILGHNQVAAKACPSFDVPAKLRFYGVPERNIYKKPKLSKRNEKKLDSLVFRALDGL